MALIDNLVSYWKLDESSNGSGAVTRNDSHSTNHLTDNATTPSTTGKISLAALPAAANSEFLSIADNASLSITGDLSFSFWVKPTSQPGVGAFWGMISKYLTTGDQRSYILYYYNNGGTLKLEFVTSANGIAAATLSVNQTLTNATWYHIVVTYKTSTTTAEIFVNGSSIGSSAAMSASLFDGTAGFNIANGYDGTRYFDGAFDEVGIWSKVLTSGEVTSLYNSGNGLAYPFSTTSIKTVNGLAVASVKTVNGLSISSVKTINGLT